VHTKLNVTGRPAQFGRNILSEVGGRLISRFAGNLAEEITREKPEPQPEASAVTPEAPAAAEEAAAPEAAAPEPAEPQVAPAEAEIAADATPLATPKPSPAPAPRVSAAARSSDDEAIDLLEFAGPSIAKRLAPVVAGLAAVWALRRIIKRVRRR
jgi:hypothetical protein